jgi:hypothetical protein
MPTDQNWLDVKAHFRSAFGVWLTSGSDTGASQGYHGANMGYDDDDSINTIGKKLTEMVNNVTIATMPTSLSPVKALQHSRLKACSNAKNWPS